MNTNDTKLVVSTQASRFQNTTADAGFGGSVQIEDIDISLGDTVILNGACLKLTVGHRYGLIGLNGVGKSSLLKAISSRLDGFPRELSVFYVEQVDSSHPQFDSSTILDLVCDAKLAAVKILDEKLKAVHSMIDDAGSGDVRLELIDCIKKYHARFLDADHERLKENARIRSGARGKQARLELLKYERENFHFASEVDALSYLHRTLEQLQIERDMIDEPVEKTQKDAKKILKGLGFTAENMMQPYKELSGGWRGRASLARGLLANPDVLLLDEPDNNLDIVATIWLEKFLKDIADDRILVIASHDRQLLDTVTTDTIVMRKKRLSYYEENYSGYIEHWSEKQSYNQRMKDNLDKQKERATDSIREARKKAQKAGDDKKLASLASKQRKLKERSGLNRNEKGHRFKLNRDRIGFFDSVRSDIEVDFLDTMRSMKLEDPPELRHDAPLLEVNSVEFGYIGAPIFKGVSLNVELGDRVGIVGSNGLGKSTLLRVLSKELDPLSGTVHLHSECRMQYYSQETVSQYRMIATEKAAVEYLLEKNPSESQQSIRHQLAVFGLSGNTVTSTPVRSLSGGQLVRLRMAEMWMKSPHLLILDEPGNHCDILFISTLTDALDSYSGAIIFVSHDRWLLSRLSKKMYTIEHGKLVLLENGLEELMN